MASERRLEVLTRHLTSASISTQDAVPDFDAEGVFLFLTRDNVELRAKMLDFLKACALLKRAALQTKAATALLSKGNLPVLQDDLYRQNFYLNLMEFRELTLQRLKKFVEQRFFSVSDYLQGVVPLAPLPLAALLPHGGAQQGQHHADTLDNLAVCSVQTRCASWPAWKRLPRWTTACASRPACTSHSVAVHPSTCALLFLTTVVFKTCFWEQSHEQCDIPADWFPLVNRQAPLPSWARRSTTRACSPSWTRWSCRAASGELLRALQYHLIMRHPCKPTSPVQSQTAAVRRTKAMAML